MTKRLLLAALFAAVLGHLAPAHAQTAPQYVFCISATSTQCNTTSNPGNGTQGDDAWLAFGKVNLDLAALQPPTPNYSLIYSNGTSWGALIPGSTGTWCLQWNNLASAPTLVACSGGGGGTVSVADSVTGNGSSGTPLMLVADNASPGNSMLYGTNGSGVKGWYAQPAGGVTSFYTITSGTNNAAAMILGSGSSLTTSGSGINNANQINGSGVPNTQSCLGSNSSGQLIAGTCGGGGSSAFSSITSGTNTAASMIVGSGASLNFGGTGVVNANEIAGNAAAFNSVSSNVGTLEIQAKYCPTTHTFTSTGVSDNCTLWTGSDTGFSDDGMLLYHTGTGAGGAAAWTGPNNSVDALPIGSPITIINEIGGGAITITPNDKLIIAGSGSYNGSAGVATTVCPSGCTSTTLVIPANAAGMVTMVKSALTEWYVALGSSSSSSVNPIEQTGIPFILSSSGSVGNNCSISGLTALAATYPNAYIYMPAGAIATGSTAGWYYAVMSSTTAGTCYNNAYVAGTNPTVPATPTAFATTGPGAFTQTTGSGIAGPSYTVAANSMGVNGELQLDMDATAANTAGAKTGYLQFGGNTCYMFNISTSQQIGALMRIRNRGVANQQACMTNGESAGGGGYSRFSADTTANQGLNIYLQLATATDWVVLESYSMKLYTH